MAGNPKCPTCGCNQRSCHSISAGQSFGWHPRYIAYVQLRDEGCIGKLLVANSLAFSRVAGLQNSCPWEIIHNASRMLRSPLMSFELLIEGTPKVSLRPTDMFQCEGQCNFDCAEGTTLQDLVVSCVFMIIISCLTNMPGGVRAEDSQVDGKTQPAPHTMPACGMQCHVRGSISNCISLPHNRTSLKVRAYEGGAGGDVLLWCPSCGNRSKGQLAV